MPDQPNTPLDPPPVTPPPADGRRRPTSRQTVDNSWTQEDEDRYQAQRQRAEVRAKIRRRQGLSFLVIVLLVILIGLVGAAVNQGVIKFGATPTPCPTVDDALPQPGDVTVNVLNGTSQRGLAGQVSKDLAARGYLIGQVGNAADELRNFPDPAQIHHGPDATDAAKAVAVQIAGATLVQDDQRTDGTVDVVVGQAYTTLVAPEEATKALAPTPTESPEDCTPAE